MLGHPRKELQPVEWHSLCSTSFNMQLHTAPCWELLLLGADLSSGFSGSYNFRLLRQCPVNYCSCPVTPVWNHKNVGLKETSRDDLVHLPALRQYPSSPRLFLVDICLTSCWKPLAKEISQPPVAVPELPPWQLMSNCSRNWNEGTLSCSKHS